MSIIRYPMAILLVLTPLAGVVAAEKQPGARKQAALDIVGSPQKISVEPTGFTLSGPRAFQQVLVAGHYADGTVRDLTRSVEYASLTPDVLAVDDGGVIRSVGDGAGEIAIRVGSHEAKLAVPVANMATPDPFDFKREVSASLTRSGCNSGACHGTPSGKNGFRLSLQGYLPDQDFNTLTRETFGRRTNPLDAGGSLMLAKGAAEIPHEGGKRLWSHEEAHRVILGWIAEGARKTPADSADLVRLQILPEPRLLRDEAKNQQVVAIGHFADGTSRDVTPLVKFSSSDEQVATVTKNGLVTFHKRGGVAILSRYMHELQNAKLSYVREVSGFAWSNPPENNYIDKHVFAKLRELQIQPSELCTDAEFLRRVYVDVAGILPNSEQVEKFLADKSADKRAKLIDQVMELPEYADFWAMKWADVLRNTRKAVAYRGAHNYRRFLVETFAENRPFNEFVTDLLTSSGDTMMYPAANYYRIAREPQDCAETTAQLVLGVRMQCAKCHNHPFERWTQDDYYGFAAFFARVKHKKPVPKSEQEVVFLSRSGEVNHLRTNAVMKPQAPGSEAYEVGEGEDRRAYLARWLSEPDNPFFPSSTVNRIWYHVLGKGIVDPVDDFRDSNPPCNEALIDALAADFVKSGYDFKHMLRTILNSRTYQLSAKSNELNADDEKYFSRAYTKLLSAEQLLDAICDSTSVPEKFKGLPLGTRAIQLPDGEFNHQFLQAFGQPSRELSCECARESDSTLNQALNLINGDVIHNKLRNPENRLGKLMKAKASDEQIVAALYLATLSRAALPEEIATAKAHIEANKDRRKALEDVHWALLNCKEFLFRH